MRDVTWPALMGMRLWLLLASQPKFLYGVEVIMFPRRKELDRCDNQGPPSAEELARAAKVLAAPPPFVQKIIKDHGLEPRVLVAAERIRKGYYVAGTSDNPEKRQRLLALKDVGGRTGKGVTHALTSLMAHDDRQPSVSHFLTTTPQTGTVQPR
jgi:hypothetical protein